MIPSSEKKKKNETKPQSSVTIVDKSNFYFALDEFKKKLNSHITEYLVVNFEYSNLSIFNSKFHFYDRNVFNYIENVIASLNTLNSEPDTPRIQIIFTELTVCQKSNRSDDIDHELFTYLIPSLQFHKYTDDSPVTFDSNALQFLNLNTKAYPLEKIFSVNSLSYSNLAKAPQIEQNLKKILLQGKPSKKENKKSYYFFPKNIFIPCTTLQQEAESWIKKLYESIAKEVEDSLCNQNNNFNFENESPRHITIEDQLSSFQLVEMILSFDWKNILAPYDRSMVKVLISNYSFKFNTMEIDVQDVEAWQAFMEYLRCMQEYFKNNLTFENLKMKIELDEQFYERWREFLFLFHESKINISTSKDDEGNILFQFKIIQNEQPFPSVLPLIDYLIGLLDIYSQPSTMDAEPAISGHAVFDYGRLFPMSIRKYFTILYNIEMQINIKSLSRVNFGKDISAKFTYENLYMNVNNSEEILFDYQLDTELHVFLWDILSVIDKSQSDNKLKYTFKHDALSRDLNNFIRIRSKKEFKECFNGLIREFDINDQHATGKLSCEFEVNMDIREQCQFNEIKYTLLDQLTELKKELLITEELGVSQFINLILPIENTNVILVGCNLLLKFLVTYSQIFLNEETLLSSRDFLEFLNDVNFLDVNYLCKKHNVNLAEQMTTLGNEGYEYTTQKIYYIIHQIIKRQIPFSKNKPNELNNKIHVQSLYPKDNTLYIMNKQGLIVEEKPDSQVIVKKKSNIGKIFFKVNDISERAKIISQVISHAKKYFNCMVKVNEKDPSIVELSLLGGDMSSAEKIKLLRNEYLKLNLTLI